MMQPETRAGSPDNMAEVRNYTVAEVKELFNANVVDTFAATEEGQKHLNRIAKAITNESLDKRLQSQRETLATAAYNKKLAEIATKSPSRLQSFVEGKAGWIEKYIQTHYLNTEEE